MFVFKNRSDPELSEIQIAPTPALYIAQRHVQLADINPNSTHGKVSKGQLQTHRLKMTDYIRRNNGAGKLRTGSDGPFL